MNIIVTLAKNIPVIVKDKNMLLMFIIFSLLMTGFVVGAGKVFASYSDMQEILAQISQMESYVNEWNQKEKQVKSEKYRPITLDNMERVQSEILLAIQTNNLQLESIRAVKDEDLIKPTSTKAKEAQDGIDDVASPQKKSSRRKESPHKAYELSLKGEYNGTMNFIFGFEQKAQNALITIRSLSVQPQEGGMLETKIRYKVYVK